MAVNDPTTNYGWNLPANGGDSGAWGTLINAILGDDATGIDARLKAVSNVADAALPKAGGTMTGDVGVKTDTYDVSNLGATLTGAVAVNLATARFFHGIVTGNVTFSFTNIPATGRFVSVMLELTNPGAATITWPAGTKWPGGSAPTFTAAGVDVIALYTRDGGTTWRAARAQADTR